MVVSMHYAKTHLSELIAALEQGDKKEWVIGRRDIPAARLVPYSDQENVFTFGVAEGDFVVGDIDQDNEIIADMFFGVNE